MNSYLPCRLGLWLLIGISIAASERGFAQEPAAAQFRGDKVTTELPYRGGKVVISSDYQDIKETHRQAIGRVTITYQDVRITCDSADYDEATHKGSTSGKTQFSQGQQSLTCSRAEFDVSSETATFYDAVGHTDQGFLIQGKKVLKTGHDTYELENGLLTSCQEKVPKWNFDVGDAKIHVDQTARLRHVFFKLKGVPVLYLPYLVVPMENKKRSAGFLPFHTGTSTSKGRQFNLGYYQPLGQSSDIELHGDYYSLRGFGFGGLFRTRPNDETSLDIEAYGVNDRLHQGGAVLQANGVAQFENGFRAVANVNMSTNFQFRQTFSETFQAATISEEQAVLFATRNSDSFSTDISFERREVSLPGGSLVTRKSPSIEFFSLGKSLGRTPLIFTLRAAAEGLSRFDSVMETPRIVQRLDFFPSLSVRVPSLAGFSIVPSIGFRETYYSARLSDDSQPAVLNTPLRRQYTDVEVSLRTPEIEGDFHSGWLGDFKHIVEPMLTYRRIFGITDLNETIRFDDQDAIADTNEIEYGIVNRIMRQRKTRPGIIENYEVFSFTVAQKYYFDPTFGGAFLPGEANQFYPLDTLTGFSATGIERSSSPVSMSLRVMPQPGISYDVRADYDPKFGRLRDTSLWAVWHQNKLSLASTFVKADALEPGAFSAEHVQAQAGYGSLSRGFSAGITLSYNIQTHTLLNSSSRLNYIWNCCGISLDFEQFDLNVRTESRFTFSFSLKGIGSFGNMKGPERLF